MSLVVTGGSGCLWTDFDDIKEDAWAYSTGKPDNDAANWGVALQRINRSGDGGRIAVLGASEAIYSEVHIDARGAGKTPVSLELNTQYAIGNLTAEPLLLADPASDEVTLLTPTGQSGAIAVLRANNGVVAASQIFGPERPDAGAYVVAPVHNDPTTASVSSPLLAQDDFVFGSFSHLGAAAPNPQPKCKLVDEAAAPFVVRALGATRFAAADTVDTVIGWSNTGKLALYDSRVFNGALAVGAGCDTGSAPLASPAPVATPFITPGPGSRILTFRANSPGGVETPYALLQGHDDSNRGFLGLYDLTTLMPVGAPLLDQSQLKTAALMELDGKRYVVAGYPSEIVDGVEAGLVRVFQIDTTAGITATPVMTLHDAQPEKDQAYGRGVAVMSYNNQPIIAVSADNDVFVYFRTNLYGETRQGR
ncbi:MAG: hypothetical protein ACTHU0_08980 [Kofleriaceae bacterium]